MCPPSPKVTKYITIHQDAISIIRVRIVEEVDYILIEKIVPGSSVTQAIELSRDERQAIYEWYGKPSRCRDG